MGIVEFSPCFTGLMARGISSARRNMGALFFLQVSQLVTFLKKNSILTRCDEIVMRAKLVYSCIACASNKPYFCTDRISSFLRYILFKIRRLQLAQKIFTNIKNLYTYAPIVSKGDQDYELILSSL